MVILIVSFSHISFSQSRYVMCEITDNGKNVSVSFGDDIKYLGTDYATQIGLYDKNNHLRFKSGKEVVSFLTAHWGWKLCGNPSYRNKGKVKVYVLRHWFDFNTNLHLQMELFENYEKTLKK